VGQFRFGGRAILPAAGSGDWPFSGESLIADVAQALLPAATALLQSRRAKPVQLIHYPKFHRRPVYVFLPAYLKIKTGMGADERR